MCPVLEPERAHETCQDALGHDPPTCCSISHLCSVEDEVAYLWRIGLIRHSLHEKHKGTFRWV